MSDDLRDYIDQQLAGEPDEDEPELELEDGAEDGAEPETGDDEDEEVTVDEDDEEEAEDEDDDWIPQTGGEVVTWAFENEADLRAGGWESAEEFLVLAASDARWWIETATFMGWPPETRPQQRDLPAEMAMGVIAASVPGARLVEDPLHRMRPGSKRRLW